MTGHNFRDSWKEGNEYKEFNYILCEKWEWQQGGQNNEGESTPVEQASYDVPQEDTHASHPQSKPDDGFMSIPEGIESELPFR